MAVFEGELIQSAPRPAVQEEPLIDRAMNRTGTIGNQVSPNQQGIPSLNQFSPTEQAFLDERTRRANIDPQFQGALDEQRMTEGLTPAQARAILAQEGTIDQPTMGMDIAEAGVRGAMGTTEEARANLANLGTDYLQGYMDKPSYTMATLERDYPELYEREQAIQAQQVGTDSIDPYLERVSTGEIATRGIDTGDISRFQDPYMQQVVDASLRDFDVGTDRASNIRRARQAGAGAFGGRQGLYDAQLDADVSRQRAGLGAGLRSQAYQQALASATREAEFGQRADISDLERSLQAQQSNQATMLAGGQDQMRRQLEAQRLNQLANLQAQETTARNIMQRKLQDAGLAYQGDQQRLGAIDAQRALQLQRANLGVQQAGLGTDFAKVGLLGDQQQQARLNQLYNMGGGQFTQPLQLLTLGTEQFGQRSDVDQQSQENLDQQKRGSSSSMGFSAKFV